MHLHADRAAERAQALRQGSSSGSALTPAAAGCCLLRSTGQTRCRWRMPCAWQSLRRCRCVSLPRTPAHALDSPACDAVRSWRRVCWCLSPAARRCCRRSSSATMSGCAWRPRRRARRRRGTRQNRRGWHARTRAWQRRWCVCVWMRARARRSPCVLWLAAWGTSCRAWCCCMLEPAAADARACLPACLPARLTWRPTRPQPRQACSHATPAWLPSWLM